MSVQIASGSAVSTGANAKSAEQVSGLYEFIGPGIITLIAKASATGLNHTLMVGNTPLVNDSVIAWTGTAGTLSARDNEILSQVVQGGRVSYTMRNTTGGALTNDYVIKWEPTR